MLSTTCDIYLSFLHKHCNYYSVIYCQVYHAVSIDQKPLRKKYVEAILPPFAAVLRKWRPLLAGIHELATTDGLNPLNVDDNALATDTQPIEVFYYAYIFICLQTEIDLRACIIHITYRIASVHVLFSFFFFHFKR